MTNIELFDTIVNINITNKKLSEIVYDLILECVNIMKVKNFIKNNEDLGLFCHDGRRYYECDEYLKNWLYTNYSYHNIISKYKYTAVLKEFLAQIKSSTQFEISYEFMNISFNNIIFDWKSFLSGDLENAFKEHSDSIIVFHHINYDLKYDVLKSELKGLEKFTIPLGSQKIEELANKLCPKSLKTFKEWVGEKWLLLYEIIGYTLYPKYDLHKAIMLIGEGANGKSTYLRLIKDVLGSENVVSISLQELSDSANRFAVAELHHKLANIYADLPDRPLYETGRFKILTGEDIISAERKFRGRITFVNYCKLIFSANQLPPVNDLTDAFWRRWLVVEFPHKFQPNPNFYEENFSKDEKEGVVLVSILAFRDVLLRRRFSYEETEADYKEFWQKKTNSVYAFVREKCEVREKEYTEANELYQKYVEYCQSEEIEPITKREFTINLEKLGIKKVKIDNRHYYKSITLKEKPAPLSPLNFSN